MWEGDLSKVICDLKTLPGLPIVLPQNTDLHDLSLLTSHHIIHLGVPLGSTIVLPHLQQIAFYLMEFFYSSYSSNLNLSLSSSERPSLLEHQIEGKGHSYSPMPFMYFFYTHSQAKIISFDYLLAIFLVLSKNECQKISKIHLVSFIWLNLNACNALAFHSSLKTCLLIIEWVIDCSLIPNRFFFTLGIELRSTSCYLVILLLKASCCFPFTKPFKFWLLLSSSFPSSSPQIRFFLLNSNQTVSISHKVKLLLELSFCWFLLL